MDVILNEFAQGLRDMSEAASWFEDLSVKDKSLCMAHLQFYVAQAHPTAREFEKAVTKSESNAIPVVVKFRNEGVSSAIHHVRGLISPDIAVQTFLLFLHLLKIADTRRRETDCADGCSHWWHNL